MSLDDPIVIGTAEVSEVEAVLEPALAPAPVAASLPSRFACLSPAPIRKSARH